MQAKKKRFAIAARSLLVLALALATLAAGLGSSVLAEDAAQACLLTVTANESYLADLAEANVVYDVYKLATAAPDEHGNYLLANMTLEPAFGDLTLTDDPSDWEDLAQDAMRSALSSTPLIPSAALGEGQTLEAGMYLVLARGSDLGANYVQTRTDPDGSTRLVTLADSGCFQYRFSPMLVSLPNQTETEGESDWNFSLTVNLKAEQTGYVDISKTLRTFEESGGSARFLFDVEAVLDGVSIYSNVEYMDFTGAGTQVRRIEFEGPSLGAVVTVTEVYSGTRYQLVNTDQRTQSFTINYGNTAQTSFINAYNPTQAISEVIVNHFEYDASGETGKWVWMRLDEIA